VFSLNPSADRSAVSAIQADTVNLPASGVIRNIVLRPVPALANPHNIAVSIDSALTNARTRYIFGKSIMKRFRLFVMSHIVPTCGLVSPGLCFDKYDLTDALGHPFLQTFILGTADFPPDGEISTITRNLSALETEQTLAALRHWAEIITVTPGQGPAQITVTGLTIPTAFATSPRFDNEPGTGTKVLATLTDQFRGESGLDGEIGIGDLGYAQTGYVPSQLPLTSQIGLTGVVVHEFGHALGIKSFVTDTNDAELPAPRFPTSLSSWAISLYDDNGNAARPGSAIWCTGCANIASPDVFDVRNDRGYFKGKHVDAVLAGAMPGIPVRILGQNGAVDTDFLAHIELKNSLMSHQDYRNFTTFTEAELAALQDLGVSIDRRNFFGYSIYGNNRIIINDHPFFARTPDGTSYLPDTYNRATTGLGLHVYGKNSTVLQQADLMSIGAGGGGIRIDGESNALTISPDTRVYADGPYGRGVLFAYGRDHSFVERGNVQAMGDHGIAVSFDFGENARGSDVEYRGSYIRTLNDQPAPVLPELNGPLVSTFDLTGRVAGRSAAIYMSENGYVGQISVMQGAKIEGDILSSYAGQDENGAPRLTRLTFGLQADNNGHSTGATDPDFRFDYAGNITGNNLSLRPQGGITQLTGNHQLYDVAVAPSATLSGQGHYQISATQQFRNDGIVKPSLPDTAVTIDGRYSQSETGTLQLAFNGNSAISSLIVHGSADLSGTLSLTPLRGWYRNGFNLTSDQWLSAATVNGAFGTVTTSLASPTLTATAVDDGDNSFSVSVSREADAYAQYGSGSNSRGAGSALDADAGYAGSGLHSLMTALDFSAADGSAVRSALPQLSAEPYASATSVLFSASAATRSAVSSRLQQAFGGIPVRPVSEMGFASAELNDVSASAIRTAAVNRDDVRRYVAWAAASGSWTAQSGDSNVARTQSTLGGFITGIDTDIDNDWRLGLTAGYSRSAFSTVARGASGSSDNYTIGAYAGTERTVTGGIVGLRTGVSYSWHNVDMRRSIAFADFRDSVSADYNAGTFQTFGELGYRLDIAPQSILEPYASLAYVHVHTRDFDEKGLNGAALSVRSGSMDTMVSTLGLRASTSFTAGKVAVTARTDFGWRHAYGDVNPTVAASFSAGPATFTSAGSAIDRDAALIEAGFDIHLNQSTTASLSYNGQFGQGATQNGINGSLRVAF
jgi:uncharacterized protein with beta-barrel porin domain